MDLEVENKKSGYEKLRETLKQCSSDEVVKGLYDEWAETYEKDTEDQGYVGGRLTTKRLLELLQQKCYKDDVRILDVGAGTGLVAEILKPHGYCNIDAVDISSGMLKIAERKKLYKKYICASVGSEQLPINNAEYEIVVATGCFSSDHIKADGLDEVVRVAKPGGIILFTTRVDTFENPKSGFAAKVEQLEKSKRWSVSEKDKINYHLIPDLEGCRYCYRFLCYML